MEMFSAKDIEKLHTMSNQEMVEILQEIKTEFLPMDYILEIKGGEMYSPSNYNDTRLQIAMEKAIAILSEIK